MEVVTKEEIRERLPEFLDRMRKEIFIYPTDTIYGIGCDATNVAGVRDLRILKKRFEQPFSIIVPDKKWIYVNCDVNKEAEEWIAKLPGPYTIVLPLVNKAAVSPDVNNNLDTIGVRIPDHWISELVAEFRRPIITTSANERGRDFMTKPSEVSDFIKSKTSFLVDEGELKGQPSKVVQITNSKQEILRP